MKKKNTIKKKDIKKYTKSQTQTRKKKRSKKGLIYNNVVKKVKSNKKSPYLKVRSHKKQEGGGKGCIIEIQYDIPGKKKKKKYKIKVSKLNKELHSTEKKLVNINKKMNTLIINLNTKKEIYEPYTKMLIKYLKLTYFNKKTNFILDVKKEMLNNNFKNIIQPMQKKKKGKSLFTFNFNIADMDNIISFLQITNKEYKNNYSDYQNTLKESEDKYKTYNKEYIQLKNILNLYFYEIYCLNTPKKKRIKIKKYDYQIIGKPTDNPLEIIGNKPSLSHQISFIKAKLIAWKKIPFSTKSDKYKILNEDIKKIVKKKEECETSVNEVVNRYKKLFTVLDEKQKSINELNLYIGTLFTYKNGIEFEFNDKKQPMSDLFDFSKETGAKLFINSLILLVPLKIDNAYTNDPSVLKFKEERKDVIDYDKLTEVEEAFTKIKTTQKRIPYDDFHKKLFGSLNLAEELFKDSKSIYIKSKKDLLKFSDLFFYTGKNYEHHNTSYLKKFIGEIIIAHYKALFILINVKNFIKNFINNKERERFTEIFIQTDYEAKISRTYSQGVQRTQLQQYGTLRGGTLKDIEDWLNQERFEPIPDLDNYLHYHEPPEKKNIYTYTVEKSGTTLSTEEFNNNQLYLYQKEAFYTELKDKIEKGFVNDLKSLTAVNEHLNELMN